MSTISRPWDNGMDIVLYGAAPFPDSPRNPWDEVLPTLPFEPIDMPPIAPPPPSAELAPHHQFSWNGVTFLWSNGNRFFGQALVEQGWRANVYPDGLRWLAEIEIGGGKHSGNSDTPQLALNAAREAWRAAVAALGLGSEQPKGAPFDP